MLRFLPICFHEIRQLLEIRKNEKKVQWYLKKKDSSVVPYVQKLESDSLQNWGMIKLWHGGKDDGDILIPDGVIRS